MNLLIDNREQELIKILDIPFERKNLLLGDIVYANEDKEYIIIERKTISDLLSSVKDSRYSEQSERYSQLDIPSNKIIYFRSHFNFFWYRIQPGLLISLSLSKSIS